MRVHESGATEVSQVGIQVGNACALRQLQMQIAMHVADFFFHPVPYNRHTTWGFFEEKLYRSCGESHHLPYIAVYSHYFILKG